MSRNLLVTGASGFIGRTFLSMAISGALGGGYRISTLGSKPVGQLPWIDDKRTQDGRYGFGPCPFGTGGIGRVDDLLLLGAFIPKSVDEVNDVARSLANLTNLHHLLDQLPDEPRRILFISSIDVYAPAAEAVTEDASCAPGTLYGLSKLFGERLLAERLTDMPATQLQIFRVGHTYGPGEKKFKKFIPNTIRDLQAGKDLSFAATGSERRAFIFVEDVCRALLRALELPRIDTPINLASAHVRTLSEVAGILLDIHERETGRRPRMKWGAGRGPQLEVVPDVTRMSQMLGLAETSLEEGLRLEYAAMRQ